MAGPKRVFVVCIDMNWFKQANAPLGDRVFESQGVWMYPFSKIKKDTTEGWYIDWFDDPGGIHDMNSASIGDKVADQTLNMTPYWEISFINADQGRIYLNPIEPNPFITGVGAGGNPITEWDMDVHSGEYEKKRIDYILDQIREGTAVSIGDVVYLLKGTVPLQMGPNGAQGGWYSTADRSNRGSNEGMSPVQIMMADSKSLKEQFGFDVPPKALSGELDPYLWGEFVTSPGSSYDKEDLKIYSEDLQNPDTMAMHILSHPQPEIKARNTEMLMSYFKGSYPRDQETNENRDELIRKHQEGGFGHPEIADLVRSVGKQFASIYHPQQDKIGLDPYWLSKEQFIELATAKKWPDVLQAYETAIEKTNRRYVVQGYKSLGDTESMLRMHDAETNPEVLVSILESLNKMNFDVRALINSNTEKYQQIIEQAGPDSYLEDKLEKTIKWLSLRTVE